ncbi:hypothetical protein AAHA92_05726 [Salvia divinorum]|uniref:Secreted protein n=1 Tax=Salvia divinorum TaxID=28513 RepID=A0ABD1I3B5_SALDI
MHPIAKIALCTHIRLTTVAAVTWEQKSSRCCRSQPTTPAAVPVPAATRRRLAVTRRCFERSGQGRRNESNVAARAPGRNSGEHCLGSWSFLETGALAFCRSHSSSL